MFVLVLHSLVSGAGNEQVFILWFYNSYIVMISEFCFIKVRCFKHYYFFPPIRDVSKPERYTGDNLIYKPPGVSCSFMCAQDTTVNTCIA